MNSACFSGSLNLDEMDSGNYELYLEINAENGQKNYLDFIRMYSLYNSFKTQNIANDAGAYSLSIKGYNNRFRLDVNNLIKEVEAGGSIVNVEGTEPQRTEVIVDENEDVAQ